MEIWHTRNCPLVCFDQITTVNIYFVYQWNNSLHSCGSLADHTGNIHKKHHSITLPVCPLAGEEVLLIQEKLDGIKSRYAEMTAGSSKALRTLEQALQLSTRFASAHDDVNQWLDSVEAELNNVEPDATPSYQERQKVATVWEKWLQLRLCPFGIRHTDQHLFVNIPLFLQWFQRKYTESLNWDTNQAATGFCSP